MKFSNNYIFYPDSQALDLAIKHYEEIALEPAPESESTSNLVITKNTSTNSQGYFANSRYDTATLESARDVLERELADAQQQEPLNAPGLAAIRDNLGVVLAALGQQLGDAELLNNSIRLFRNALEGRSQEEAPEDWAQTQSNLGAALLTLGQLQQDTKSLKESIEAYTNTLTHWTRSTAPVKWASAMHNLGVVLHEQGKLLKGNRTFQKSVVAFKNAQAEWDMDDTPLEWAMTYNNLGAVLQNLGEREENPQRIEEAIKAYETALRAWTEQQMPMRLAAKTKVNLGTARRQLAELTKDAEMAETAVDDFILIVEVFGPNCDAEFLESSKQHLDNAKAVAEGLGGTEIDM
jgi:tetratricopeptide (TPR) repeat protein